MSDDDTNLNLPDGLGAVPVDYAPDFGGASPWQQLPHPNGVPQITIPLSQQAAAPQQTNLGDQPTPKAGQTVQQPNVMQDISSMPGKVAGAAADVTGVSDAYKAATGQMTPEEAQMFALGALPALAAGPEGKAVEEGAALGNEGLAYLLGPKSQVGVIGREIGSVKPNGISVLKVAGAPEGYGADRLVYAKDGQIVGAMQVTSSPTEGQQVANTYVHPDYRRAGIATQLNDFAEQKYGGPLARSDGPSDAGAAFRASLQQPSPFIRAFHGSPYDFDQFDLSKIGTGEGAQAYGHGLYFAEEPAVATGYKDQLASSDVYVDGKNIGPVNKLAVPPMAVGHIGSGVSSPGARVSAGNPALQNFTPIQREAIGMAGSAQSFDEAVSGLREQANQSWRGNSAQKLWNDRADALEALRGRVDFKPGGKMYEVNINADPEHFLDWDKPLSEQSPHVQQAIAKVDASVSPQAPNISQIRDPQIRGIVKNALKQNEGQADGLELMIDNDSGLYNAAVNHAKRNGVNLEQNDMRASDYVYQQAKGYIDALHASQNLMGDSLAKVLGIKGADMMQAGPAAARLRDAGIPGIRYLDQGSRFNSAAADQVEGALKVWKDQLAKNPDSKAAQQQVAQLQQKVDAYRQGGTRNYVIFNDKLIDIVKKYGLAGLVAGGASHFQTVPVDNQPDF